MSIFYLIQEFINFILFQIEIQQRKELEIPLGWAQDTEGNMTTDATVAFNAACLMPLGGAEVTSGFKGYGLGAMVDVLCGVLAGANFSTKVRSWTHMGSDDEANLGQFFMAIDPKCFAPGFTGRMSEMTDILRNLKPMDPNNPVLIAGDPERIHMKKVDAEGGLNYHENQIKTCNELAVRLSVTPIKFNC